MKARDTKTGSLLEAMIEPALRGSGYAYETQVDVGTRPGGRRHRVDVVAQTDDGPILVSVKWQQVTGTAEQKVPFEVICLAQAVRLGPYRLAYLVLGGEGWTLREFYTSGLLGPHLSDADTVKIVTLESFVALASRRGL